MKSKGHATRNDIVDDIVDFSSSTMAFNVAKIASARASLTISLTKSLRVAGPLLLPGCALANNIMSYLSGGLRESPGLDSVVTVYALQS